MLSNIDWILTGHAVQSGLDFISKVAWPAVGGGALWFCRNEVRSIVGRVRTIKGVGVEAELSPGGQSDQAHAIETAPALPPTIGDGAPPEHNVYSGFDVFARDILESHIGGDCERKLAWAIRMRSISEVNRIHEANYRILFGSQLKALKTLNVVVLAPISTFEPIFDEAKADPNWTKIHEGRTFEQWGEFIINIGYAEILKDVEPPTVRLTPIGQNFLLWMTEARVPEVRAG
jgi:hypothetical protein